MRKLSDLFKRRDQLAEAYRAVFETPQGEIVLAHLAKTCHILEPSAVAGDPHMTYLHEGERRVVLSIMKMLGTDFSKLQQMMEEQNV
jgi:hypothetical protein